METPIAVANYFIKKALDDGTPVTSMKLLKLTYIAHGWYLGLTQGEPLLNEGVEAWKYGPVIPSLYHTLKSNGYANVTRLQSTWGPDMQPITPQIQQPTLPQFLDKIWEIYSKYDGLQLSALTHQENTPWSITWHKKGGKDMMGSVIPNHLIGVHYQEMLAKSKEKNAA